MFEDLWKALEEEINKGEKEFDSDEIIEIAKKVHMQVCLNLKKKL